MLFDSLVFNALENKNFEHVQQEVKSLFIKNRPSCGINYYSLTFC